MSIFTPSDVPDENPVATSLPFKPVPGLDEKAIGEVVTIQVFERIEPDGDELNYESMLKTVGVLDWYQVDKDDFAYALNGYFGQPRGLNRHTHYVEVFVHMLPYGTDDYSIL